MKKIYKIEVDCAHCANLMEDATKKTPGVQDAVVNFMTQKMTVTFEEGCEIQFYDDRDYYNSPAIHVYGTLNIEGTSKCMTKIFPSEKADGGRNLCDPTIEAVAIETDEIYCTKYALMAAQAGKHIHMEKPGGIDHKEYEEIVSIIKKAIEQSNHLLLEQAKDNISYMNDFVPLTQKEIELCHHVADIINSKRAIQCTACAYCVKGCPMEIQIPDFFETYNRRMQAVSAGTLMRNKNVYLEMIEQGNGPATCIECGQCERACPQHLTIRQYLKVSHLPCSPLYGELQDKTYV